MNLQEGKEFGVKDINDGSRALGFGSSAILGANGGHGGDFCTWERSGGDVVVDGAL